MKRAYEHFVSAHPIIIIIKIILKIIKECAEDSGISNFRHDSVI